MKKKIIIVAVSIILIIGWYLWYKRYSLIKFFALEPQQANELKNLKESCWSDKVWTINNMWINFTYPKCRWNAELLLNNYGSTGSTRISFSKFEENTFSIQMMSAKEYMKIHKINNIEAYLWTGWNYCEVSDKLNANHKCIPYLWWYLNISSDTLRTVAFENWYHWLYSELRFTKLSKGIVIQIILDYWNIFFHDSTREMIFNRDYSNILIDKYLSWEVEEWWEEIYKWIQLLMETIQVQ